MQTPLQQCQDRHDRMAPPELPEIEDKICAEVQKVLALESKLVPFIDRRAVGNKAHVPGFALDASEALASAGGHECIDVQIVLAILAGEYGKARIWADQIYRPALERVARRMVITALRRR